MVNLQVEMLRQMEIQKVNPEYFVEKAVEDSLIFCF